jgi:hypothetical protein
MRPVTISQSTQVWGSSEVCASLRARRGTVANLSGPPDTSALTEHKF